VLFKFEKVKPELSQLFALETYTQVGLYVAKVNSAAKDSLSLTEIYSGSFTHQRHTGHLLSACRWLEELRQQSSKFSGPSDLPIEKPEW